MIGTGIFHYIYHIGCAFNFHSVINNGLIPGGQDLSRRQTVFFLPISPRDENHKDPEHIDFSEPRRARCVRSAWKRHQDAVFWVDIDLAIREGLTFNQNMIECNYSSRDASSPPHSKSWKIENWRSLVWKKILVSSTTTKDLIETRSQLNQREWSIGFYSWAAAGWETRSAVFGEVLRVKLSNPTQSKPNPICDRSVNLRTQNVFPWIKEKRPVHKRSMINVCIKNLALQIEQGNLWNCLKTFASCMLTMEQGNLWNRAQAHTVKEFVPAEHRDIASSNANSKFNLATDEENIDFNIQECRIQ